MWGNVNIGEVPTPNYKIKLENIALYVQKVTSSDTCRLAIINTMKIALVKYQIHRVKIAHFQSLVVWQAELKKILC